MPVGSVGNWIGHSEIPPGTRASTSVERQVPGRYSAGLPRAQHWTVPRSTARDDLHSLGPFGLADFFAVEKDPETRTRILAELMTILSQPWYASLVCLPRVSASASNAGLGDFD